MQNLLKYLLIDLIVSIESSYFLYRRKAPMMMGKGWHRFNVFPHTNVRTWRIARTVTANLD